MFYFLKGTLALLKPNFAVIDAGGVGYKITIGERTYAALSGKSEAKLFTHLAVREDGVELFGFLNEQELDTFLLLTSVSGVGPKGAIAIL
jgi:Holliday junction DNA helicase RuvA